MRKYDDGYDALTILALGIFMTIVFMALVRMVSG